MTKFSCEKSCWAIFCTMHFLWDKTSTRRSMILCASITNSRLIANLKGLRTSVIFLCIIFPQIFSVVWQKVFYIASAIFLMVVFVKKKKDSISLEYQLIKFRIVTNDPKNLRPLNKFFARKKKKIYGWRLNRSISHPLRIQRSALFQNFSIQSFGTRVLSPFSRWRSYFLRYITVFQLLNTMTLYSLIQDFRFYRIVPGKLLKVDWIIRHQFVKMTSIWVTVL